jgi:hypothetical protein
MVTTGLPKLSLGFFSAASLAVSIPAGIQVFAWIATMAAGRARLAVPMLFILGFLFIFVLGGLSGVMVAVVPFDLQVHDTYFVVAHLHYVLIGGMVFPLFAALLLLGADGQHEAAVRAARPMDVRPDVRRLQSHLLPDAYHRAARHAAPGLHLPGGAGLGRAEPAVDGGRLRACGRHPAVADRPGAELSAERNG